MASNSGWRSDPSSGVRLAWAAHRVSVDNGKIRLFVGGFELDEEIEGLVE